MIPATQNAHTTLQKHCGCPPAAHNAALADAPAAARRTRPALPILPLTAKIRDLAQNAVWVIWRVGALVGKVWGDTNETRQVPGGVHGTPRRGI